MPMSHEEDPKKKLLEELGDISNVELFHNQVLLAVYLRPEKTKSGLIWSWIILVCSVHNTKKN
jgi:hypothetical protein